MAKVPFLAEHANMPRIMLNVESVGLSPEQFYQLCRDNPDLRLELTAQKEIVIMSPTNSKTGRKNAQITFQLVKWSNEDGTGIAFESSTGFTLPNGAKRAPDASWITRPRWEALTPDQTEELAPICPDFVLELWSPSDIFKELQYKMIEYVANGARLGFLIYPPKRQVIVYRPNQSPERLENPLFVSADPELPGFTLDLKEIWE